MLCFISSISLKLKPHLSCLCLRIIKESLLLPEIPYYIPQLVAMHWRWGKLMTSKRKYLFSWVSNINTKQQSGFFKPENNLYQLHCSFHFLYPLLIRKGTDRLELNFVLDWIHTNFLYWQLSVMWPWSVFFIRICCSYRVFMALELKGQTDLNIVQFPKIFRLLQTWDSQRDNLSYYAWQTPLALSMGRFLSLTVPGTVSRRPSEWPDWLTFCAKPSF